jgi:hypothetical protein
LAAWGDVSLINPCADEFHLRIGQWIAAHGHAWSIGKSKNPLDQQTVGAFAGKDSGTGTSAAKKSGRRSELEFAHGGVTQMARGARLLKNRENVFVES